MSLLFLPTSFRAGAEAAHGHAFLQLLVDAADGQIHHHQVRLEGNEIAASWLDPRVELREDAGSAPATADKVDTGSHEDSTPATASIHMLVALVSFTVTPPRERAYLLTATPPLIGLQPVVLSPPPR